MKFTGHSIDQEDEVKKHWALLKYLLKYSEGHLLAATLHPCFAEQRSVKSPQPECKLLNTNLVFVLQLYCCASDDAFWLWQKVWEKLTITKVANFADAVLYDYCDYLNWTQVPIKSDVSRCYPSDVPP